MEAAAPSDRRRRRRQQSSDELSSNPDPAAPPAVSTTAPPAPPSTIVSSSPDRSPTRRSVRTAGMNRAYAGQLAPRAGDDPLLHVPPAYADEITHDERRLLLADLEVDPRDVYPANREPTFVTPPPAPGLGQVGAHYVELPGANHFKRVEKNEIAQQSEAAAAAADGGAAAEAAAAAAGRALRVQPPAGAVSASMGLLGVVLQASQGVLAGASIVQLLCTPPYGELDLARHMAYAPVAIPLHRTLQAVAFAAFLSGADAHAAVRSWGSVAVVLLHGACVLLLALQLPMDAALSIGRAEREEAIREHLFNAGDDAAAFTPANLTSMVLEESSNAFFGLAAWQLDLWKTCVVVRTACAILAWILNSLRTALPLVTLPPAKSTTSPPMRRPPL